MGNKEGIFLSDEKSVQFLIEPEFQTYLLNQNVTLRVVIYNNTENPYQLRQIPDITSIDFNIQDPLMNKLECMATFQNVENISYLNPGDSMSVYVKLDLYFFDSNHMAKNITGSFTIMAYFQDLTSNKIDISVITPEDGNKEIFDKTKGGFFVFKSNEESKMLEELLNKYPSSPYGPQLYYQLFVFSPDLSDTTRFSKIYTRCFDNYPNSYLQADILTKFEKYLLVDKKLDREEYENTLKSLAERYKNTFIEKSILKYIQ